MGYSIDISPAARRSLKKLDAQLKNRINQAIVVLAEEPRPFGCIKMEGSLEQYRIRISDYRVVYEIHDDRLVVVVVQIAPRDKVYKKR